MEQLRIDLVPMGVTPNAHASQFDVGRVIRFLLYNGGTAYTLAGTETITVKMAKPDGTEETVSVTNTSSNYVDFITTDGLLNQAGLYPCEISITSGTDVIGSKNFNLRVELDPYDGHNIRRVTVGPADICTFDATIPEPYQSVTVNVEATGGNGTPDNPIAINGYTEANITRCGVNIWNEETESGSINSLGQDTPSSTQIRTVGYVSVKPSTTYYLKTPKNVGLFYYDASKTLISSELGTANSTFTTPSNCAFIRWYFIPDYGTTYNNDTSINYPATDTTYHAYNGNTYTIAFGQTVYGGVLDVTRGKLTVTHGGVDLSTLDWTASTYGYRTADLASDVKTPATDNIKADIISEAYNPVARNNIGSQGDNNIAISTSGNILVSSNSTPTGYAVYELATPFDIDLTPVQIRALVGENNVFADCGETEVEYLTEGT